MTTHTSELALRWTGNRGTGTSGFRDYDRANELLADGRPAILGSSDPTFRGDPARWNPEQLLVASLAQCHMLWYLHLAAVAGVVVTAYADAPTGTLVEDPDGGGRVTEVTLRPAVTVRRCGHAPARRGAPRAGAREVLHRQLRRLPRGARADRRCR